MRQKAAANRKEHERLEKNNEKRERTLSVRVATEDAVLVCKVDVLSLRSKDRDVSVISGFQSQTFTITVEDLTFWHDANVSANEHRDKN